jgi:hypothetical protein
VLKRAGSGDAVTAAVVKRAPRHALSASHVAVALLPFTADTKHGVGLPRTLD